MLQANKHSSIKVSNNEKNDCEFMKNCQNDTKNCNNLQNYNDFNKSDIEKNYKKTIFETNFNENLNGKNSSQLNDSGVMFNDTIKSLNDNMLASTSKQFESSATELIDEEEQENDEGIVLNNDLEFSVASFLQNFNASKTKNILSNNINENVDDANSKGFSNEAKLETNKNKLGQKFGIDEKNEEYTNSCDNSETNTNQNKTIYDTLCCSHSYANSFDATASQTNAQNELNKNNLKCQQQINNLLEKPNLLSLNFSEIDNNKEIDSNTKNLLNNIKRRKITLPQKRSTNEKKTKKAIITSSPKTKENCKVLPNQLSSLNLNEKFKELDISLEVANSMIETFGQAFSESTDADFLQHISVEEAKSIARLFGNDSEALMTFLNSVSSFFGVKNESVTLELLNNIQNIATQTSENLTTENNLLKSDQVYDSFLDLSKKSETEKLLTPEQLAFAEAFLQMLSNSQTPINLESQTPIFDSSLFLTPEITSLLNNTNGSQTFDKNLKNCNGNLSNENLVKNDVENKVQRLPQTSKTKDLSNFENVVTTNSSTHSVGSPSSSALSSPASTSFSSIASTSSFNAPIIKTASKKQRRSSEKVVQTINPTNLTQNMSNSLIASVVLEALMYSTSAPAALTMLSNDKNVQNAIAEYFALSSSTNMQSKLQEKNFNNELSSETKVTEEMLKTALNNALSSAICDTNTKINENLLSASTGVPQTIKLSGAQTVASVLEERRRKRPRTTSKSGLASATPLKSVLASSTIKNVSNTLSNANLNLLTNTINGTTVSAAVNNSRAALESGVSVFNGAEFLELSELEEFANSFKKQRIKHGFTQGDIGVALGKRYGTDFSQTTISRFEALNLSYKNMCKLRPLLKEWLEEAEQMIKNGATVVDILEAPSPAYLQNSYSSSKTNSNDLNNFEEKNQINSLNSSVNGGLNSLTTPRLVGNSMIPPLKRRRKRTNLDNLQKAQLDVYFKANCRPDHQQMNEIAASLDLDPDVIRVWFCNRRQKLRKIC